MKKYNTWSKPKPTNLYSGEMQESWEIFLTAIKDNKVRDGVAKVIPVRTSFVDMLDYNYPAAILLTQIVYWHLPQENENGKTIASTKLRVFKYGHYWLAKKNKDWFDEGVRLSEDQVDRALKKIKAKGFVKVRTSKFDGTPTNHIRLTEKFFTVFFEKELEAMKVSAEKNNAKTNTFTSGESQNRGNRLRKIAESYNIDNRTKITDNNVTYSPSILKGSVKNGSKTNSLSNHEDSTETFIPVGELSGGDSRNASVEEAQRVSDYSKYNRYAEDGWQLVDQVKNPMLRPLTENDPYFFHVFEEVMGKPYPWPQDLQNNWVLERLQDVEDEWVDTYFEQNFREKTNYRVHHFLSPEIQDRLHYKNM